MKPTRHPCSAGVARLAILLSGLASLVPGFSIEPVQPLKPVVVTNQVLVTNIVVVVVTNHVVTTNLLPGANPPAAAAAPTTLPDLSWVPPVDDFDWVQLKSGEWLKGRIRALQNDSLDFVSEELDDQTFDWKDIRQLRSARALDVLFVDGGLRTGPVTITPERVMVGGSEPRVEPRAQLQSLVRAGSRELDYWSGKGSLSATLRSGNLDQFEYTAQLHLQRRTPATRLSLDYIGNVSAIEGVENANNHRVNSEFDYWLSRRFYLILPFAEYYKDPFQNLRARLTGGVGVGYDLVDRPALEWNITAGPAYQQAWFESAQPGEPTEKGSGALAFGSRFDWDINRRVELILEYRGQYTSPQVGETTHHSVATLSLDITKRFDLDVSFIWDRVSQPKTDASGVTPLPDDFRLVVGLGLEF
jgi:hypothetical protein